MTLQMQAKPNVVSYRFKASSEAAMKTRKETTALTKK
jgi:hypothetical protein